MNAIKDRLAKLLATENITVRHSATASTASFDVKDRVLTLPVWKNLSKGGKVSEASATDIYDLMVGHEVGHALYTPYKGWESAITDEGINKNILNIVEDPRIEKLVKRKYPGLRKAFLSGYGSLMELGFFGNLSSWDKMTVLDRLNMHFKGGAAMQVPFDDAEMWMVEGIEACETWDHVVEITKKIQMAYSELLEKSHQMMDTLTFGTSEFGDSDNWDTTEDMPGEWGDSVDVDSSETPDGNSIDTTMFDSVANDVDDGEASTVEEWEARKQELANTDDRDVPFYIGLPKPNLNNIIVRHKQVRKDLSAILDKNFVLAEQNAIESDQRYRDDYIDLTKPVAQIEYNKFRTSSGKIINYMVKEFERKKAADEYKRTSVDKTGILNVTKLHEYKYSDDLFLKRAIVHDGKNHGLVFLLDWSASMHYHLENTIKQLLSLVWFCNKVNIPFEVYAFTSGYSDPIFVDMESKDVAEYRITHPNWDTKHGDVVFSDYDGFKMLNLLSSRQSAPEINQSMFNLFYIGYRYGKRYSRGLNLGQYELGSTPLVQAMCAMQEIIPNFRNYHKLDKVNFICLTDGEGNTSWDNVHNAYDAEDEENYKGYTKIPHRAQVMFDDPKTRKTYDVDAARQTNLRWSYSGANQVVFLLTILKDRYDINTIGIFLTSERGLPRSLLEQYLGWFSFNRALHKAARKECKTAGFATIRNAGYDEYYLVPTGTVQIDDSGIPLEDGEGENLTKGKLKNIFVKSQKRKFGNRILVNQMMDLIT